MEWNGSMRGLRQKSQLTLGLYIRNCGIALLRIEHASEM